jgi:tRNA/rRNA methyltransferase
VLVRPRNPLNIGAAARAMSNFGFFDLRLVEPYDIAWKEARSAIGAAAVLEAARVYSTVAAAVTDCSLVVGTASLGHRDLRIVVRRLEYGARLIRRHLDDGPAALLFGSEKFGLSNEDLSQCHWLLRIPTREEHESMNLGQAVAVCLYELVRRGRAPGAEQAKGPAKATAGELALLEDLLDGILRDSGYSQPRTSKSAGNKLRRLLCRMELNRQDAQVWLGMLRQLRWKLNSPKD